MNDQKKKKEGALKDAHAPERTFIAYTVQLLRLGRSFMYIYTLQITQMCSKVPDQGVIKIIATEC